MNHIVKLKAILTALQDNENLYNEHIKNKDSSEWIHAVGKIAGHNSFSIETLQDIIKDLDK